jgi:hypothetical protein
MPILVIPINKMNYMAIFKKITLDNGKTFDIRFINSYRFLSLSLEGLAKTLRSDDFCELKNQIEKDYGSEEHFELLRQKGIFPYNYMTDFEKFKETKLPSIDHFYSDLTLENITQDEYRHAQNVWNTFKIKKLREYTELYLKTDVMLLADIFQNFRKIAYEKYGLEPLWFVSLGSLSWTCMMRMTDIKIDLLTDLEMVAFFYKNLRGGVVQLSKKYAVANNEYLKEGFDPSKPKSQIIYLDFYNLYGYALSEPLPVRNFKWVENIDIWTVEKICQLTNDSKIGYIFDVDLEYPKYLHDTHTDYPFAVEKNEISDFKRF